MRHLPKLWQYADKDLLEQQVRKYIFVYVHVYVLILYLYFSKLWQYAYKDLSEQQVRKYLFVYVYTSSLKLWQYTYIYICDLIYIHIKTCIVPIGGHGPRVSSAAVLSKRGR